MRVLIAYGSRYGGTEEISSKLAEFLEAEGIEVTLLDTKKNRNWPTLLNYDGVIVGSSVKITKWMKEPLEFLKRKRDELGEKKLALFVSCLTILNDPDYARTELLDKIIDNTGVKVELYEAFGPVIDMRKNSRMGFIDKKIAQTVMVGLSKEFGLEFDMKRRNDLRDWDKIRGFADKFVKILRA